MARKDEDEDVHATNGIKREEPIKFPRTNLFIFLTVLAIAVGVGLGIGLRSVRGWDYYQRQKLFYLRFPGDLLINMQKMMILPLVVSSMVSSLASLKGKASGKMGFRAVLYYLSVSLCGVIIGVTLVLTIRPGERGDPMLGSDNQSKKQEPLNAIFDLIRNCFPDNLIAACFQRQKTVVSNFTYQLPTTEQEEENITSASSSTGHNSSTPATESDSYIRYVTESPSVEATGGMNVLGLAIFSIFFGATISNMGQSGKPLVDIFDALHQATLRMMMIIIWYSPIGIIFLIATKLIEIQNLETIFVQLGYYIITVLVGISVHIFIVMPLVFCVITKKNPFLFMFNMLKALLTAWVTSSSLATLPITMECLEVKNKADMRVAKFMTPIGATVNIASAGVYEMIAALFISQINGMTLDMGQLVTISLASVIATIGTGLPSDILITMSVALTAAGLPVEDIGIVVAVDWFLDRFSTPVNVLASAFGVGIVEHLSRNDLQPLEDRKSNGFTIQTIIVKEDTDLERCARPTFTTKL